MYLLLAYTFVTELFTDILEFITYKTLIFSKRSDKCETIIIIIKIWAKSISNNLND